MMAKGFPYFTTTVHLVSRVCAALGVGCADDAAAWDSAAGDGDAEAVNPVIAAREA